MKKRLKDFLTGVGSVLEIYPNAVPHRNDHFHSDLERIGGDFKAAGNDIRKSIEVFSQRGSYKTKSRVKESEEDLSVIRQIVHMSLVLGNCRSSNKTSSPGSVKKTGEFDWNHHSSEELDLNKTL